MASAAQATPVSHPLAAAVAPSQPAGPGQPGCDRHRDAVRRCLPGRSRGVLHRHHGLHRLQGVRGRLQEVEPAPRDSGPLSGDSYDNTRQPQRRELAARQVHRAVPRGPRRRPLADDERRLQALRPRRLSGGLPTGAIIRTEYDTVVIQADVCNGCRDCIAACPFGVIEINPVSKTAMKCTLCYDRLQSGLEPACAKACPTDSIKFGTIEELHQIANERVQQLNTPGASAGQPQQAYLYGADDSLVGGLNSFYLLVDKPEVYGLPAQPSSPPKRFPRRQRARHRRCLRHGRARRGHLPQAPDGRVRGGDGLPSARANAALGGDEEVDAMNWL